jgi:Uma2 family endonuclease
MDCRKVDNMAKNLSLVRDHPVFSNEEYLNFERFAGEKHEFIDGSVYAMAGESSNHSTICFNLYTTIGMQLRRKRCRGFSPNMKVATDETGLYSFLI